MGLLRRLSRVFNLAAVIGISSLSAAAAKEIHLPSLSYRGTAGFFDSSSVERGDVLVFSDGARFEYQRVLSSGGTTLVLEVSVPGAKPGAPTGALRVPLDTTRSRSTAEFIEDTVKGYPLLKRAGVPIPEMLAHHSPEYALMERVDFSFDGVFFLRNPESIAPEVLEEAEDALVEFARKTALMQYIGDFKADQIVYSETGKKWVLLDWQPSTLASFVFSHPEHHAFKMVLARDFAKARLDPRQKRIFDRIAAVIGEERVLRKRASRCVSWLLGRALQGKPASGI